ncbi:bifunctional hydroxymethylpyrimidine kinase/phosphomethylpyrimidine kinase [Engelhardtia mirabilis]|uniref:Hydroxymethylpyrimidine/phosphomethylpyrimidine kinase n=1 Tax=Engelhardtia mirabilis TaxID=2528011 RepID=A0A518BH49_9BACT|nr:Hydroxymethylpyrimidine/phosphomethylpyrimidine kinase [Planctomycetes bacterium Pla133]QDV00634.1 Hydroxymethylpyrimidine/phosphomethylpyrimidine kinase [Planctomycetes bacterium Pla86]
MSRGDGPRVLVCAGRDPTGGAGIDADATALAAAGARAVCVVTTETDQDGRRVRSFAPRAAQLWRAEAEAQLERGDVAAVKFGLLCDGDALRAAGHLVERWAAPLGLPVVVDPVLAASGGERFLPARELPTFARELLARGVVVTPNTLEAAELSGLPRSDLDLLDGRLAAARRLLAAGAGAVVLKGGHGAEDPVRDLILAAGRDPEWAIHPRIAGGGIHGSGCRHASFLAGRLAAGSALADAAREAGAWLRSLIERGT